MLLFQHLLWCGKVFNIRSWIHCIWEASNLRSSSNHRQSMIQTTLRTVHKHSACKRKCTQAKCTRNQALHCLAETANKTSFVCGRKTSRLGKCLQRLDGSYFHKSKGWKIKNLIRQNWCICFLKAMPGNSLKRSLSRGLYTYGLHPAHYHCRIQQ